MKRKYWIPILQWLFALLPVTASAESIMQTESVAASCGTVFLCIAGTTVIVLLSDAIHLLIRKWRA